VRNMRLAEVARPAAGRVALLSDGVSLKFSLEPTGTHAADAACRALFAEHGKSSDDATLLIADL
jgi:hypothetical protein